MRNLCLRWVRTKDIILCARKRPDCWWRKLHFEPRLGLNQLYPGAFISIHSWLWSRAEGGWKRLRAGLDELLQNLGNMPYSPHFLVALAFLGTTGRREKGGGRRCEANGMNTLPQVFISWTRLDSLSLLIHKQTGLVEEDDCCYPPACLPLRVMMVSLIQSPASSPIHHIYPLHPCTMSNQLLLLW